ncbi:SnoaL-like domain-containing protein [Neolewinella antarctica]|uniref:SnoaL-like domain-containing protein n=1 Tax=Neolewinella antarctica TaxID=442734 RepID=A0ABX0XGP7_9BACT|nr:SnoaL-like domain-containing protein [Neolewinella antarctica]NJC28381.1 hypothetical protein [Neolewinella antarctica]
MTIQQVADRLVTLTREGKSEQAYKELFAKEATSHEMPGVPDGDTKGLDALLAKSAAYDTGFTEVHQMEVSDPVIYGEFIALGMGIDVTRKDGTRSGLEQEICVYHVRNGKIQSERFIYAMG